MQTTVQLYTQEDLRTADTFSVEPTILCEGTPRLQACVNAVELAIIANSTRIGYSFDSMHHKSTLQLPTTLMLGKERLRGTERLFCNMQLSVLNDLAEAKRRWTEKKSARN